MQGLRYQHEAMSATNVQLEQIKAQFSTTRRELDATRSYTATQIDNERIARERGHAEVMHRIDNERIARDRYHAEAMDRIDAVHQDGVARSQMINLELHAVREEVQLTTRRFEESDQQRIAAERRRFEFESGQMLAKAKRVATTVERAALPFPPHYSDAHCFAVMSTSQLKREVNDRIAAFRQVASDATASIFAKMETAVARGENQQDHVLAPTGEEMKYGIYAIRSLSSDGEIYYFPVGFSYMHAMTLVIAATSTFEEEVDKKRRLTTEAMSFDFDITITSGARVPYRCTLYQIVDA